MARTLLPIHGAVFIIYLYAIYYDVQPPRRSEYEEMFKAIGGRFKYLTFLNLVSVRLAVSWPASSRSMHRSMRP